MTATAPADTPAGRADTRTTVATTEELRRAALERSAQRGAEVARQRLAKRRAARVARLLLTWLAPLLLLGSLGWASRSPAGGEAPNDSTLTGPGAQAQSSAASARTNRGDP